MTPPVTIKRFAEMIGVSVKTVRRWIANSSHPLPCYRPTPKTILIRWQDFDECLEVSRREGAPEWRKELDQMLRSRRTPAR